MDPQSKNDAANYLPRQQNYQFAYSLIPSLFFQRDFARIFVGAYPSGMGYLQASWEKMADVYPPEHVASRDKLKSNIYQALDETYFVLITVPHAERILEVARLALVFRPNDLQCFALGRSASFQALGTDIELWTLRQVGLIAHQRCGTIMAESDEEFAIEICNWLEIQPNIYEAKPKEFQAFFPSVPTFSVQDPIRDNYVWNLGAIYKVLSEIHGDTSGLTASAVMEIFHRSVDQLLPAVQKKIAESEKSGRPTRFPGTG